jgi:glycosyltransferase involved in cell wall biosynthesis
MTAPQNMPARALYAAFDRFPSCKGAAIHIDRFARALFDFAGGGLLYVVGDDDLPAHQIEGDVEIVRFSERIENFLQRSVAFGEQLGALLEENASALEIAHYRDPWSGLPIVARPHSYRTIFEVNALPSIELQHAYDVAPQTLRKIESMEDFVLQRSDDIVVPANRIREHLMSRGVLESKISVVPNGAELYARAERPVDAPPAYVIYIGALQEWQGIATLLRAFAKLRDLEDLHLVICSSQQPKYAKAYMKLAEKLELQRVIWLAQLSTDELQPWLQHAIASLAPLTDCARNVTQGCAPLKILESMAAGVPVIASDLPAVRELMTDRVEGMLIPPDRPAALARAMRILYQYPEMRRTLGDNGRARVASALTWDHSIAKLRDVYAPPSRLAGRPAEVR